jgi:hypothetical protein
MTWTLYKTASPETSVDYPEFYELSLKARRGAGKVEYQVVITHGWWDDKNKEIKEEVQVLNTGASDGLQTYSEACQQYTQQKQHFARNGFIHAFSIEIPSGRAIYELIAP